MLKSLANVQSSRAAYRRLSRCGHFRPSRFEPERRDVVPGGDGIIIFPTKDGWWEEHERHLGMQLGGVVRYTVPGEARSYARMGVMPVEAVLLENGERRFRLTPIAGGEFLIATVWAPFDHHSRLPGNFAVLDAPVSKDLSPFISRAPFVVDDRDLPNWMNPVFDKGLTHRSIPECVYNIEEV